MNNGITYGSGHKIDKNVIVATLESIGCKDIKDVDYDKLYGGSPHAYSGKAVPDFECSFEGKACAVEIGDLQRDDRINRLLDEYSRVIHIFADKKLFLLHCVQHTQKRRLSKQMMEAMEGSRKIFKDLLEIERANNNGKERSW